MAATHPGFVAIAISLRLRRNLDEQQKHETIINAIPDLDAQVDRLVELNVVEQTANLANTSVVQEAWDRGQKLSLHSCVYALQDGLLRYVY